MWQVRKQYMYSFIDNVLASFVCIEMMMRVEDLVIKALIAGEFHISAACDVFQAHKGNCFGS